MVITACAESFSLPLSLPSASACRTAFSISRWPLTPSVLRNFRMLVLNTSSFMAASFWDTDRWNLGIAARLPAAET